MPGPMKMRATMRQDNTAEVRVLMSHPMETGLRKGPDGKLIPMHFIEIVTVKLNGKVVINGQTSQSVSRNPVFAFRLKGAKPGDKVEISWLDNKGESNKIDGAIA